MTEAKRRPGRPRILATGDKRRTVTFDPETLALARIIGDGNINAGVRLALREFAPKGLQVATGLEAQPPDEPV